MDKKEFFSQIGQFRKNVRGKLPSVSKSIEFIDNLSKFLFPVLSEKSCDKAEIKFNNLSDDLSDLLIPMAYDSIKAKIVSKQFMNRLPVVYEILLTDAKAIFKGDPAANSIEEVVLSYPGFWAICIYRLAHELVKLEIPLIPRIVSEFAHSETGIDIHPSASIGHSFSIDHGTGVVIGETAQIGNHVKIYQGVTIGALSVNSKKNNGIRHPKIEDHVTIYAGASILGGNTIVGAHSVIGGNVWVVESIKTHSLVTHSHKVQIRKKNGIKTDLQIDNIYYI